jgi:hypothetical protein
MLRKSFFARYDETRKDCGRMYSVLFEGTVYVPAKTGDSWEIYQFL